LSPVIDRLAESSELLNYLTKLLQVYIRLKWPSFPKVEWIMVTFEKYFEPCENIRDIWSFKPSIHLWLFNSFWISIWWIRTVIKLYIRVIFGVVAESSNWNRFPINSSHVVAKINCFPVFQWNNWYHAVFIISFCFCFQIVMYLSWLTHYSLNG
jgi:hypothetical protein